MEVSDLQEEYELMQKEREELGDLDSIEGGPRKLSILMKVLLWIVIFTLVFWSVAWLY